ncbi:hypothetical protein CALCODRAFT_461473 [Calocera cornea HHB12733]|uniref:C2H2-type domain-containing protein n=1 Tax=Calocera cornea HHB12733 TaxID=1353952 RepID=A0A165CDZ6_9BASI|nr:hypothetical protein CALCODRAFT_461473 [Calocera cornea HHB12733]
MAAAVLVALPSKSVLGKRKAAPTTFRIVQPKIDDSETGSETEDTVESFVSQYSEDDSSNEEDEEADSESESGGESLPVRSSDTPDLSFSNLRVQGGGATTASSSRTSLLLVNGKLLAREKGVRPKRYACTWPGCEKAYTKPVRLEEHERSHTGDRPYRCDECGQSYMRDTHLAAHVRTHKPDSEKPYACSTESCGKRFWTSSQLKLHIATHRGDRPFACEQCEERFVKHAQLRKHVAAVHCPPGTKVFRCLHEGCGKSFEQSAKLRAHERKHEPDRYACSHPSCLSPVQYFNTWSALQTHIRQAHAPSCPYKMCSGKVFKAKGNLKAHIKMHQDEGHELNDSEDESEEERGVKRRRRKNGGEFRCEEQGCVKSFHDRSALNKHRQTAHLGLRPFKCNTPGCDYACGYKHVLQRHIQRHHTSATSEAAEPEPTQAITIKVEEGVPTGTLTDPTSSISNSAPGGAQSPPPEDVIALLTGAPTVPNGTRRVLHCPWPDLLEGPFNPDLRGACNWTSGRVYDLWRHLRSAHTFECERQVLETWVKEGEGRLV